MSRLILCALLCLSLHVKNVALLQHPSVENARSLLLLASGDGDEPLRQLKDALLSRQVQDDEVMRSAVLSELGKIYFTEVSEQNV